MGSRDAEPAAGNGGGRRELSGTEHPPSTARQRPFGDYLPDELRRKECLYRWFLQQPDLSFPEETKAILNLWLEEIAEEWAFRERHNISAPGPSYTFGDDLLQELKAVIDLRQLADEDVPICNHGGRAWMTICPFHDDKRPSLAIYPNGYVCFSCDAHGDLFDWLALFRGIREFPEQVRHAAALAGRPLPERVHRHQQPRASAAFQYRRGQVVTS